MNYSSKRFLGDTPYSDYEEYLKDLTMYVVISLRNYIINNYNTFRSKEAPYDRGLPGLEEVLHLLELEMHKSDVDDDQDINDWYENMQCRREMSRELGKIFPIDHIVKKLGMDDFAIIILMVSLMGTIYRKYDRVFQFINGDGSMKHPTLDLCAGLYEGSGSVSLVRLDHFINQYSTQIKLLFPLLNASPNISSGELICDERLIDLIYGKERCLTRGVDILDETEEIDPILFREEELKHLTDFIGEKEYPLFLIYGERGSGKKHLVRHFAKQNHCSTVLLDMKSFQTSDGADLDTVKEAIRYAARECILKTLPLAISGLELLNEKELEHMIAFINDNIKSSVQLIFLLLEQEQFTSGADGLYIMGLRELTELERIELWKYYSRNYELEGKITKEPDHSQENSSVIERIANTFLITPGQIVGALRQAALLSGGRSRPLQEKLLYKACYAQLNHKLAQKTSKVSTTYTWEDLKMPPSDKEILRDICNCVKNKHIVMNEWNFSKIIPYGAGLTVLFSGPPGTGKTMAAQVVANELNMELYKIDLSQVFDKYVGETEKNIKQIFEQAKKSNSILFFDEADSIFNKRLEASSANDRFANVESSLLLQCVEEYSGISILATNNFNSIDAAFIRRFKFYILFREPDEAVRYEIWKSVLPREAPISRDVDLRLLAKQFEFTGAVIKNVVISAAYLAAEKGEDISMIDILRSIKREMFKNNLILTKDKLGSLGYLFDDLK